METLLKVDEKHKKKEGIISVLEDIQKKHGYLPEKIIRSVADETGYSLIDIYGVATFYKYFSLKPRGEHLVSVCLGTACHVRQGPVIVREFEKLLGIRPGDTTKNKEFTLETVNCLGACARGPIVVVDGHYFSNVKKTEVSQIIKKTREGLDKTDIKNDKRIFPVKLRCSRCNHSLMDADHPIDEYPSVRLTVSFGRKHGWIRLSSLYGSYTIISEYKIPDDLVVNFFCPYCHSELLSATACPLCDAPMVPMIIHGGGMVQICSRHGCKNHMMELFKGLCINCDNRHTCQLIKPNKDIWYCEEYK